MPVGAKGTRNSGRFRRRPPCRAFDTRAPRELSSTAACLPTFGKGSLVNEYTYSSKAPVVRSWIALGLSQLVEVGTGSGSGWGL
jgi:hypothetical protein